MRRRAAFGRYCEMFFVILLHVQLSLSLISLIWSEIVRSPVLKPYRDGTHCPGPGSGEQVEGQLPF